MGEEVSLETKEPWSKILHHDVSLRMFEVRENRTLRTSDITDYQKIITTRTCKGTCRMEKMA
jgi:hypothetical protein